MQREPQPDRFGPLPGRRGVRADERRGHHPHPLGPQHLVEALAVERVADGGPGAELGGERGGGHRVRPGAVAGPAHRGGRVDGDRDARHPVLPRERPPAGAALGVHPGRVDDGGQPARHPPRDDLVEQRERVGARRDVVLARADDAAQRVRRDDGRRREVSPRPTSTSRTRPGPASTTRHGDGSSTDTAAQLGARPPSPATRRINAATHGVDRRYRLDRARERRLAVARTGRLAGRATPGGSPGGGRRRARPASPRRAR